jgi:hypothetical protein
MPVLLTIVYSNKIGLIPYGACRVSRIHFVPQQKVVIFCVSSKAFAFD